jgi:hypothetical protein
MGDAMAPAPITQELLDKIEAEFIAAESAADVRAVFKRYYTDLGWKRLCRLFVLEYPAAELWLAEEARGSKAGKDE